MEGGIGVCEDGVELEIALEEVELRGGQDRPIWNRDRDRKNQFAHSVFLGEENMADKRNLLSTCFRDNRET